MCCKEGQRVLRSYRDLKTRSYWKNCKGKRRSGKKSLKQERKGRLRVSKKVTGGNLVNNGTWTIGRKRIAVSTVRNGSSCANSSEYCCNGDLEGIRNSEQVKCGAEKLCVYTPLKKNSSSTRKDQSLGTEADLELLPLDILVRIVCHVHHDELKPLFHVSTKFREAVVIARQMHFDYTTPVRVRASKRRANALLQSEDSEAYSRFEGVGCLFSKSRRPSTPNAPKQVGKIQRSRILSHDIKEIATLLFPTGSPVKDKDETLTNHNQFLRSNRVLFAEDELCEAVARNKL